MARNCDGRKKRLGDNMNDIGIERLQGKPYFNNKGWWVCPFNFIEDVRNDLKGKKVIIHDCTLRDGEQTFGVAFSPDERVRIAEALAQMQVPRIEVGMPPASPDIMEGIKQVVKRNLKAEIISFIRTMKEDIDKSIDCGVKTVILEHITNPYACKLAYGLDKAQVIDRIVSSIQYAKEKKLKTIFMGWDMTRGDDLDFIKDVYTSIVRQAKPSGVVVVDTLGVALPWAIRFIFRKLKAWIPEVPLEFHTHNEFGLANAGILEAVAEGASVVHTAVNGLGERTGNAATEEVVAIFEILAGLKTGIILDRLMDVSVLVENISRRKVASNKPVVGRGLFDMETGIGVDLHRKLQKAGFNLPLQPFLPDLVGQDSVKLVMGKNSGAATIEYYIDKLGLKASDDQVKEITDRVKQEGRLQRALLTESQFEKICKEIIR
jgi:2-isopropylmalate synthase